jgi:hypothetical protein
MKKYLLFVTCLFVYSSCTDYLDVKPTSQVDKDVLFQTEDGFYESLIGVYSRSTENDIYGYELSFGLPDVLAQNYSLPSDTRADLYRYRQVSLFNYNHQDVIAKKDGIWIGLYNAISNCNLILEKLEEHKNIFADPKTYSLIKGEALALRAYFHFDALRLFAPSYSQGSGASGIPYVTSFSNVVTPHSSVDDALTFIIADLEAAKALLKEADPIITDGYIIGYTTTSANQGGGLPVDGSTEEIRELFLQNRRHRMNYYAVCGSLARACLYKNDKQKALENAVEVIESGKFPFTDKLDFTADDDSEKDRILYQELLFAWYIPNKASILNDRFENRYNSLSTFANEGKLIFELGGPGAEDFRYKQWLIEDSDGINSRLYVQKYLRDDSENKHYLVAPALRLSEMYYIAAECVFDADPALALEYFNTVRFHRGIGNKIEGETSKEVFLTELVKDARKEFFAEGQIFYMYKRLHRNIVGQAGSTHQASDRIFVLPLPDDEIAFGE